MTRRAAACSFAACVASPGAVMTMRGLRCLVPSLPNSMAMPIVRRLEPRAGCEPQRRSRTTSYNV